MAINGGKLAIKKVKKQEEQKDVGTIGVLTKEQFYRWRFSIEEMRHAETEVKLVQKSHSLMEAQLEIAALRTSIHKAQVTAKFENFEIAKKQYASEKELLEKELGYSLNDTIINEITLEVKKEV